MNSHFEFCPKCGHFPMPKNQSFPCECPRCGLILAKYRANPLPRPDKAKTVDDGQISFRERLAGWLFNVPDSVNPFVFWGRFIAFVLLSIWGWRMVGMDVATGELGGSFVHTIFLPFHEAGHLIFRPFGEFITYLGGTLGQLLMPIVLMVALIRQNGDSFGASLGFWLFGVSLLDVAPYMYDALNPQLILLGGATGAEGGGHDWMYLFGVLGKLQNSQHIGLATKAIGTLAILLGNVWGAYVLFLHYKNLSATSQSKAAPS